MEQSGFVVSNKHFVLYLLHAAPVTHVMPHLFPDASQCRPEAFCNLHSSQFHGMQDIYRKSWTQKLGNISSLTTQQQVVQECKTANEDNMRHTCNEPHTSSDLNANIGRLVCSE